MQQDPSAKKMPRFTSPASFQRNSIFLKFLLQFALTSLFVSVVSGSFSDSEDVSSETNLELYRVLNAEDDCVTNYNPNRDYFPSKIASSSKEEFRIQYFNSYKVISNQPGNEVYVAYLCGTPVPRGISGTLVQIPPKTIGIISQTHLPFFHILEVENKIALDYTSVDLPSCVKTNDDFEKATCFTAACYTETWANQKVNMLFLDSFTGAFEKPTPPQSAEATPGEFVSVVVNQEASTTVPDTVAWVKFISAFLNKEELANRYFTFFTTQNTCLKELNALSSSASSSVEYKNEYISQTEKAELKKKIFQHTNDPVIRNMLLENRYTSKINVNRNLLQVANGEKDVNVLILTGFDPSSDYFSTNVIIPSYYIGICPNYYCEFANGVSGNIKVIDAVSLGLDEKLFLLASQEEILAAIETENIRVDAVLLFYYVDSKGEQFYPGPEEGENNKLTELITSLNNTRNQEFNGESLEYPFSTYYIPDTNSWFTYRPGVPYLVQSDFIKMLAPFGSLPHTDSPNGQNSGGKEFYFFHPFPHEENPTINLLISPYTETCDNFEILICGDGLPPRTSSPTFVDSPGYMQKASVSLVFIVLFCLFVTLNIE